MPHASQNPAYNVFQVSLGWCAAARSEKGICRFVLPVETAAAAEAEILESVAVLRGLRRESTFRALARAVARYFDGRAANFAAFPVDLSAGTPFQQSVWSAIRRIPRGHVRTYKWIGDEIERPNALRAIGRAVGANPVPLLVPCHRVIGSDGSLVGFSAAGGIALKAKMLEIEGIPLRGSVHAPLGKQSCYSREGGNPAVPYLVPPNGARQDALRLVARRFCGKASVKP